jgi:hypothetical protein
MKNMSNPRKASSDFRRFGFSGAFVSICFQVCLKAILIIILVVVLVRPGRGVLFRFRRIFILALLNDWSQRISG